MAGAVDSVNESFTLFIENSVLGQKAVKFLTDALNGLAGMFDGFEKSLNRLNTEDQILDFLDELRMKLTNLTLLNKKGGLFFGGSDSIEEEKSKALIALTEDKLKF